MNIQKLNFSDLSKGNAEKPVTLPPAPKNFSYFAKNSNSESPEFTKSDLNRKVSETQKLSFEDGFNKGKDEVIKSALSIEQNTKEAIDSLISQISKFLADYEEQKKEFLRNMTKISIMAIRKISQKIIKEDSEQIILQALEKASAVIAKQPEVVIKAKKIILEKIQDKVDNLLKEKNFIGKIIYSTDDTIADGNCVIQWGESGVNINSEETLKQIEELLSEYLKSI